MAGTSKSVLPKKHFFFIFPQPKRFTLDLPKAVKTIGQRRSWLFVDVAVPYLSEMIVSRCFTPLLYPCHHTLISTLVLRATGR
jgi:hypothetical protein